MISFQKLCEYLTCNQRYSWFELPKELEQFITEEEWSICVREYRNDYIRCFYPVSKHQLELKRLRKYKEQVAASKLKEILESAANKEDELNLLLEQDASIPLLADLRKMRIAASIKDNFPEVRRIDNLIEQRCKINAWKASNKHDN